MHISFDFDYTLADSSKGAIICANHALQTMGRPTCSDADIKKTIGISLGETYRQLTNDLSTTDISTFTTLFLQKADEVVVDCIKFYGSTKVVLGSLKEEDHFISIVSTKYSKRINAALVRDGLLPYIDVVIGGDLVDKQKPSPEGINKAVDLSKFKKEETFYIGDSKSDGLAAQAAGVGFIGVLTGMTPREKLLEYGPVEVISDLIELKAAIPEVPKI